MRLVKSLETIAEEVIRTPFSEFPIENKKYFPTYDDLTKDDNPIYSYIKFCEENDRDNPSEEQIVKGLNHIFECPAYIVHYELLRLLADDTIKVVMTNTEWGEHFGYAIRD